MEAVLTADKLVKRYGNLTAVDHLDLVLKKGECLALLGPNGAGKTTTVEILEGLMQPDAGVVEVFGRSLGRERRGIMQRVGVVLQETQLYKRYTVRETLHLFASFFQKAESPAKILQQLALEDKADAKLNQLSGGQRQRLYLGTALINNPDLIFLDEPTTGLDPQARRMIWDILRGLKKQGRSILLTTHYMEEAENLADRVAIIDQGRIIALNSPRQLVQEICGEQIVWVQLEKNGMDSMALRNKVAYDLPWFADATAVDAGFEVTTADAARCTDDIFSATRKSGVRVSALQMRNSTLEDVFLKLAGRRIRDG